MKPYDYLIVGSGLFGATFAHFAHKQGKRCLVIDKRQHLGGNVYCENIKGINVHKYGAHIFHTSNKKVWDFVNAIVPFNRYTNAPVANYKGKLYNLPFNMNTFYQMWGVTTPDEALAKLNEQKAEAMAKMKSEGTTEPRNLEEQAKVLIGNDIYEKLIKGYTEKQWGRKCAELPAFIIKRLPVRMVFDNNYFNDSYQGIPIGGYNKLIDALLQGIETKTDTDFFARERSYWATVADKIVYTGQLDEFFDFRFGRLDFRTVRFETEVKPTPNYQATPSSTTPTPPCLTPASSSTSISSCSVKRSTTIPTRSSAANTAPNGNRASNPIIPSTTTRTTHWPNATEALPNKSPTLSSAADSPSINTMIWPLS